MPETQDDVEIGDQWRRNGQDQMGVSYRYPVEVRRISGGLVFYEITDEEFLAERCNDARNTEEDGGNVEKTGLARFVTKEDGEWVPDPIGMSPEFRKKFDKAE